MYINDITKIGLNCETILYADDTTFIFSHKNLAELEKIVNENMIILTEWLLENKLVVNYKKSHFMIIGSKNSCNFKVSINNNSIIKTSEIKILGVIFDDLLKFDSHINARALKASKFLRIFSKLRYFMPLFSLNLIFKAIVLPQMTTNGCEVWGYTYQTYLKKLEVLQNRMATVLTFSISCDSSVPIFAKLKWFKLVDVITINSTKFIFKAINGMQCEVTNGLFSFLPKRRTRSDNELYLELKTGKYNI